MHVYEKIGFEAIRDIKEFPKLKFHIIECPQCHLRHPVPSEYTDWREVAERYELAYADMSRTFVNFLKEAGEQFDVPLLEYFDVERALLIEQLKGFLETRKGT